MHSSTRWRSQLRKSCFLEVGIETDETEGIVTASGNCVDGAYIDAIEVIFEAEDQVTTGFGHGTVRRRIINELVDIVVRRITRQ